MAYHISTGQWSPKWHNILHSIPGISCHLGDCLHFFLFRTKPLRRFHITPIDSRIRTHEKSWTTTKIPKKKLDIAPKLELYIWYISPIFPQLQIGSSFVIYNTSCLEPWIQPDWVCCKRNDQPEFLWPNKGVVALKAFQVQRHVWCVFVCFIVGVGSKITLNEVALQK